MSEVITFTDQRMANNTYLLVEEESGLIIDPSFNNEKLKSYIANKQLTIKAILLTHGHYDHFAGVDDLGKRFNCPYYISGEDEEFLYDSQKSYARSLPEQKPLIYPLGILVIGEFKVGIIEVPGHTPGSVTLNWENNLFTGDFLFAGDIGRTDLPGGSPREMENSLRKFAEIKGDYLIYPGHEESTTLAKERKDNQYLNRYI